MWVLHLSGRYQGNTRSNPKSNPKKYWSSTIPVQQELCQCQTSILIQPITRNFNVILLSRLTRCQCCKHLIKPRFVSIVEKQSAVDQIAFMSMDWKLISQDWSGVNVSNIWPSLDLYQLLTSNQLLIKLNLNKHQYKTNWCLIRVISAREFFLAETLNYNWNLGLIQRRK
jgi:hypothetical protein